MEKIAYRCLTSEDWKDAIEEYKFNNINYSKIEDYYKLWDYYGKYFCFEVVKDSYGDIRFGYCDMDWYEECEHKVVEYVSKRNMLVVELL